MYILKSMDLSRFGKLLQLIRISGVGTDDFNAGIENALKGVDMESGGKTSADDANLYDTFVHSLYLVWCATMHAAIDCNYIIRNNYL